jgi:hypothetical protein
MTEQRPYQWERTFDLSVPVPEAWRRFHETDEPMPWNRVLSGDPYYSGGAVRVEGIEVDPEREVRWEEVEGDDRIEMTAAFTETATGTRITITRCGFGDGEAWAARSAARLLGWVHAINALAVHLETGALPPAIYRSARWLSGADVLEETGGLRVVGVEEAGWAARAGLSPGDLLVAVGPVTVASISDLWVLHATLDPHAPVAARFVHDGRLLESSATPRS